MARINKMVTRTIETTTYNVMCFEVGKENTTVKSFTGDFSNDDEALRILRKRNETDTLKLITIVNKTVVCKMYGMSESDFIKYAVELDPTTRKEIV